ncbi:MAG: TonB-dependent receptor [Bacteroidetes bacterium]|nr:TonB-dependent receptor [Bacteroidota bacterium]
MKPKYILLFLCFSLISFFSTAQKENAQKTAIPDTLLIKDLNEVVVTAVRSKVPLKEIPASISIVNSDQLTTMSKTIATDEALRLVPGVRVDNGTGGSRVHLYIRGQGVLTESGFRGIGVMLDGIPLNDPAGFAPDLYDVDWATVSNVEIVKGLAASLYGAGTTSGVLNINTMDGGKKPVNGLLYMSAGSYGFWKVLGQVDGTEGNINYRVSYSHTQGHGYREHQAFRGDIFNEKLNWTPTPKIKITQLLSYTNYFNQNSEGINLGRYDTVGPRAANTDAVPYNEFHKTQRLTGALLGKFDFCNNQDIQVKVFARMNKYQETSNNGDDHKPFNQAGVSAQYDLHFGKENLKNHISVGADYSSKTMTEIEFGVPDGAHIDKNRVDSYFSEEVFDLDTILINQVIKQRSAGVFLIDKLDIARKLFATLNIRYDYIYNELVNNIPLPDSVVPPSGNRSFDSPSFRFGLTYSAAKFLNIYANYGTGFLVPTEDELYNNPAHWGGFNETIKPSKMYGGELGIRGDVGKKFYYDVAGFLVNSKDEFYRYSIPGRGNNTAFFGNIGASRRYGVETSLSYAPFDFLRFDVAYTYANCQYTSPDSVSGHFIPQCPEHVLAAEVAFKFLKHFTLALATQYQSKWYIQTDDSIYNQYTENGVKRNSWVNGFNIYNASLAYHFRLGGLDSEISLFAKNLFDEHYFGFTEPNNGPDYNSYQPAPGREFFASLRLRF